MIQTLNETLKAFHVEATVSDWTIGPTVTQFELTLGRGVKVAALSPVILGDSGLVVISLVRSTCELSSEVKLQSSVSDTRTQSTSPANSNSEAKSVSQSQVTSELSSQVDLIGN